MSRADALTSEVWSARQAHGHTGFYLTVALAPIAVAGMTLVYVFDTSFCV